MTEPVRLPNELLSYELQQHRWSQQDLAAKLIMMPPEDWEKELRDSDPDKKDEYARKATVKTVRRWEQGISTPSPYYLRRLIKLFDRTAQELGYPEIGIPFWSVPHSQPSQNEFFMDREDYLLRLHSIVALRSQQYKSDKKTERTILQPQALVGLGGIGKTQIAIEYAYRYAFEYQTVIWLRALSTKVLESDFVNIATIVNLPEKYVEDPVRRIAAVKEWLIHFTRWLLIFDDAEDVEAIRDFLPPKRFGHVIVTTRSPVTGKLAQTIEVGKIPLAEATSFLLHRSKALGQEVQGTEVVEEKYAQARHIAQLADGLPLMLEQAAAYIETTGCGVPGYLVDYEMQGALVRQKPQLPEKEYSHTVATAWLMSFENVRQTSPVAADLLSLFAFLTPDAIPEEMITKAASKLEPVFSTLADNPLALNGAMAVLRKHSLVKRDEETKSCEIHSLVQAVIRDNMEEEEQRVWAVRAVIAVNEILSEVQLLDRRYLPSALKCFEYIEQWNVKESEAIELLGKLGAYFTFQGEYTLSVRTLNCAYSIIKEMDNVLLDLYFLVIEKMTECYRRQGKHGEAALLLDEVILQFEEAAEHYSREDYLPIIFRCLLKLAIITIEADLSDKEAALDFYKNAMNIWEEIGGDYVGNNILDTLTIMNDVGDFLTHYAARTKEYDNAESFLKSIIEDEEVKQGMSQQILANLYTNLGQIYLDQDKYEKAETLFQEAISLLAEIVDREYPTDHPEIASVYNKIALLYFSQATDLHPVGLSSVGSKEEQSYIEKSITFLEKALVVFQRVHTSSDSHFVHLVSLLGLYVDSEIDRYDDALLLFHKLINEDLLEVVSPSLEHWCYYFMGQLHEKKGHYDIAETAYITALKLTLRIPAGEEQSNWSMNIYNRLEELRKRHPNKQLILFIAEAVYNVCKRRLSSRLSKKVKWKHAKKGVGIP